eukprot:5999882-Pleurochrysis_carterae.AAC.4
MFAMINPDPIKKKARRARPPVVNVGNVQRASHFDRLRKLYLEEESKSIYSRSSACTAPTQAALGAVTQLRSDVPSAEESPASAHACSSSPSEFAQGIPASSSDCQACCRSQRS